MEFLKRKTIKSTGWVLLGRIIGRVLSLISTIILARMLCPNDFGLFGICCLTISILNNISQSGFDAAIIQKKDNIESYLNTVWTVNLLRGVVLGAILYLTAPIIGIFFNSPGVVDILRVLALFQLIDGFQNIGMIIFQKELQFDKRFIYETVSSGIGLLVGVTLAYMLRNVWALVYASLANSMARLLISYIIHPYRPRINVDFGKARELFGFGRWIMGSNIVQFLFLNLDDIVVGRILGPSSLGYYQMAYKISNMPTTEITHTISKVSFPAYSKIQDKAEILKDAYLKVLKGVSCISIPIAGLIYILCVDFIEVFLGVKWLPVAPAIKVLVLWGVIRSIGAVTGPLFMSIGKPGIVTKLQLAKLIILILLIYPLTEKWDILGASYAVVICALCTAPVSHYLVTNILACNIWVYFKIILVPVIATFAMVSIMVMFKNASFYKTNLYYIFLSVLICAGSYGSMALVLNKLFRYDIFSIIK